MMSDAQEEHQSPIRTPKQLIIAVIAAFVVPIFIIVLLVIYVTGGKQTGEGSDAMSPEAVAARIAPVAQLELTDASAPRVLQSGEAVYKAACVACHGTGVGGAPKFGDGPAWTARIAQGAAVLYENSIKGYQGKNGVMPAKGGNSELDDIEVQRAVVFMANAAGAKLIEPAAPAAAPVATAEVPAVAPSADVLAALNAAKSAAAPAVAAGADVGKKIYDSACMACHATGAAGAPKLTDKANWTPRIAQGLETLYTHSIKGFQGKAGVMPAKGGSSASDEEVKAAVRYMVNAAK